MSQNWNDLKWVKTGKSDRNFEDATRKDKYFKNKQVQIEYEKKLCN